MRIDALVYNVFCSFLALLLRHELQRRLAAKQWSLEWEHVVNDLNALHERTIMIEGRAYVVRSEAARRQGDFKLWRRRPPALPLPQRYYKVPRKQCFRRDQNVFSNSHS